MKRFKLIVLLLVAHISAIANAGVYTFNFNKVDSDNKICGVEFPGINVSVDGLVFSMGEVELVFTNTVQDNVFFTVGDKPYCLKIYDTSEVQVTSKTDDIVKIEVDFYHNDFTDWGCTNGSFTNSNVWEGSSKSINFSKSDATSNILGINSITVTTAANVSYTESDAIVDLVGMEDGEHVKINSELECTMLSHDCIYALVTDNKSVAYLYSSEGLSNVNVGQIVNPGVKGKKTTIDGVVAIEVEKESIFTTEGLKAIETDLTAIDESMIGEMVEIKTVSIVDIDGVLSLSKGGNTLKVENLMLESIEPTAARYRANVVGVIGNDGTQMLIHPTSVVVKLYSDAPSTVMNDVDVRVEDGMILIKGNYSSSRVYNVDGILVAENKNSVRCQSGVYVVVVDGTTIAKVIMR